MAHTAPPSAPRRKLEIALGVFLLLIAVGLSVVTVIALNHPKGRQAAKATSTVTSSLSGSSTKPSGSVHSSATSTATATSTASSQSTSKGVSSSASNTPTTSAAGEGKLPLIVLNNSSDTPASVAAQRFQAAGWSVSSTSTFAGDILNTAVYYDPGTPGAEAAADALQQQFPVIKRVKEKFDGLPTGPLVVILDSDYS